MDTYHLTGIISSPTQRNGEKTDINKRADKQLNIPDHLTLEDFDAVTLMLSKFYLKRHDKRI